MQRFGDELAKVLQDLGAAPGQVNDLRLEGNNLAQMAGMMRGWSTAGGQLDTSFMPLQVVYSKVAPDAITSFDVNVATRSNNLLAFGRMRSDGAVGDDLLKCVINGDTTAAHYFTNLGYFDSATDPKANCVLYGGTLGYVPISRITGATGTANVADSMFFVFPNCQAAQLFKGGLAVSGIYDTSDAAADTYVRSFHWLSTERVRTLTFSLGTGPFSAGSSLVVLGIA